MDNLNPASSEKKHYALLIGVDEYVSKEIMGLGKAPKKEVEGIKKYLTSLNPSFEVKTLLFSHKKEEDKPTRNNIINNFKSHLIANAKEGNILLFYFCGHGSLEKAHKHWVDFQGSPVNETLICYDSRVNGVWDLSDKELKYLITQAAEKKAEVIVIVDSCHSGSITRNGGAIPMNILDQASKKIRPLNTYEGGKGSHEIPRHVLLSSCQKDKKAFVIYDEVNGDFRAKFTQSLLSILRDSATALSYRDIINKCRALVERKEPRQTPQLEAYNFFDTFRYFLNLDQQIGNRHKYGVSHIERIEKEDKEDKIVDAYWKIDFGLSRGMPFGTRQMATFELFEDEQLKTSVGHCRVSSIQQNYSKIEFDETTEAKLDTAASYWAVSTCLPIEKLRVYVQIAKDRWEAQLTKVFEPYDLQCLSNLVEWYYADSNPDQAEFLLDITDEDWSYQLRYSDTKRVFFSFNKAEKEDEVSRFYALRDAFILIENWQRCLQIAQPIEQSIFHESTGFSFDFSIHDKNGKKELNFPHDNRKELMEITLDYPGEFSYLDKNNDKVIDYRLKWENREERVHLYLLDFEFDYKVCSFFSGSDALEKAQILGEDNVLYMSEHNNQEVGEYKLLVGQESFSNFILEQEGLEKMKKGYTTRSSKQKEEKTCGPHPSNWFTQTFKLKLLRDLGDVGPETLSIPNTSLSIGPHPKFRAKTSLISTAKSAHSHELDYYLQNIADQKGWTLLDLSLDGRKETLLELHHIKNKEALSPEQPLCISLGVRKLDAEQELLAVTIPAEFPISENGELYQSLGLVQRTSEGRFELKLEDIPENPADGRSVPEHSLKIGFFIRQKQSYNDK